jgi:hypothetical protein
MILPFAAWWTWRTSGIVKGDAIVETLSGLPKAQLAHIAREAGVVQERNIAAGLRVHASPPTLGRWRGSARCGHCRPRRQWYRSGTLDASHRHRYRHWRAPHKKELMNIERRTEGCHGIVSSPR